ncbi:MAG: ABC transporter ATP-binding protein [Candidatus Thermoplasmatota archaeon]|nr:ABC transporter ATP-binding protein [Candidatus Thermoplasmatota archaeon]
MDIELKSIHKTYKMGETFVRALRNVGLRIGQGELVAVTGPSGSGKTTLMNMLGILDRPTKGTILINRKPVSELSEGNLSRIRLLNYGFVFQQFYLLPTLTAFENVYLPIKESRKYGSGGKKRAFDLLGEVGMEDRANHLPSQLSGGEQQRVAIARALANDPPVILADEPTGELDTENSKMIIELLRRLNRDLDKTLVSITHDPEVARRAKRSIRMKDGKIV